MSGWRLDIPELDNPQPVEPPPQPKAGFKTKKILHLSDPHVQRDYKVGREQVVHFNTVHHKGDLFGQKRFNFNLTLSLD